MFKIDEIEIQAPEVKEYTNGDSSSYFIKEYKVTIHDKEFVALVDIDTNILADIQALDEKNIGNEDYDNIINKYFKKLRCMILNYEVIQSLEKVDYDILKLNDKELRAFFDSVNVPNGDLA